MGNQDFVIKRANTAEEAIALGLEQLGKTAEQVNIEVLGEGAKGFLGIGKRMAEVKITPKYDLKAAIRLFLKELTVAMNLIVDVEIREGSKNVKVILSGENMGLLIGKRGQTLDAIQHITNLVVNKNSARYVNVIVDTENYRQRRRDNLEDLAVKLGRRVKLSGKSITLEPMTAAERRIIHSALEKEGYVTTRSAGQEPFRYIIIEPK
ncbi:MAG: protein jag [Defluviitaleaceae bacterium]|nr:protein jag [Defluviitaleaceae bacterium]